MQPELRARTDLLLQIPMTGPPKQAHRALIHKVQSNQAKLSQIQEDKKGRAPVNPLAQRMPVKAGVRVSGMRLTLLEKR